MLIWSHVTWSTKLPKLDQTLMYFSRTIRMRWMFSWYFQILWSIWSKCFTWNGLKKQNFEIPIETSGNSFLKGSFASFDEISIYRICFVSFSINYFTEDSTILPTRSLPRYLITIMKVFHKFTFLSTWPLAATFPFYRISSNFKTSIFGHFSQDKLLLSWRFRC